MTGRSSTAITLALSALTIASGTGAIVALWLGATVVFTVLFVAAVVFQVALFVVRRRRKTTDAIWPST